MLLLSIFLFKHIEFVTFPDSLTYIVIIIYMFLLISFTNLSLRKKITRQTAKNLKEIEGMFLV